MLYGRDAERAVIGELLDAARASRSGAIVLRGEAGVGKTALLEDSRERATDMRVLVARGIEAESELPFAGVHQLIRPALDRLGELSESHRTALESAFGLGGGTGQQRFLVYSACLMLLSDLAEHRPVLCLVDDAHWLDAASADALLFVARRLESEGIAFLFAAREGDVRRFEAGDVPSLTLAPLDPDAASILLAHAARHVAPAVRERLLAHTHGNPLALVELPRALSDAQLSGAEPLPDSLPMTRQLEAAFNDRVRRLPEEARLLLLLAAADDSEDLGLVTRAGAALGAGSFGLDPAERAGLISVHGTRLVFRHPLVRSAVYGAVTSGERRTAHRALADVLTGDDHQADRRAWHLASSALEPDEEIVRELEHAAQRAEARGGHAAAARALERAGELSVDPATRVSRFVHAARNMSLAGHDEQAVALAARVDGVALEPALRGELALVRAAAAIRWRGAPVEIVPELIETTRELASTEPSLAIELLIHATAAAWQGWDQASQLKIARVAATVGVDGLDEASRVFARSIAGFAAMIDGDTSEGVRLLSETVVWGATVDDPRHVVWASWAALWLGDEDSFEALLQRATNLARTRGEFGALSDALGMRSVHLSLIAQRYDEASIAASEAIELARALNADNLSLLPTSALAIVAAVRGQDDEARRHGEEMVQLALVKGHPFRASPAVYALALVDMARSRWGDALDRLRLLTDTNDPAVAITAPERVEAAVRAGRPEHARETLAVYEAWAGYSRTPSAQPRVASCRALLASGDEAHRHFQEAIRLIDDARPFDRGRIHLLFGEHLRRERRRVDAREHLRSAIGVFEGIGAEPWADRARAELRASGETARRRDPGAVPQLTPQELQIARLVAQGLTNKEVAAQLFLSRRTIDSHLRGVFAKLGIASRRELRSVPLATGGRPPLTSGRSAPRAG
jgi:DNA-binding CsgD family transcriptional regulator